MASTSTSISTSTSTFARALEDARALARDARRILDSRDEETDEGTRAKKSLEARRRANGLRVKVRALSRLVDGDSREENGGTTTTTTTSERERRRDAVEALEAEAELDSAFGDRSDGEDRFDAFVGLVGMLNVLLGGRQPGPPADAFDAATTVEGWILGQTTVRNSGEPAVAAPVPRLVDLLRRRNAIDHEIAQLIGRPALPGHIGEFIAAELFDIELHPHANARGSDGIFRSGPLAGRTVNVKFYGRRDGLLDIPEAPVDHLLVLTGAPATSPSRDSRPVVLNEVFFFDTDELVATLRDRGVAVGTASSLRRDDWRLAQAWPDGPRSVQLPLSEAQMMQLVSLRQA